VRGRILRSCPAAPSSSSRFVIVKPTEYVGLEFDPCGVERLFCSFSVGFTYGY
jgi:hypothetical protein